MHRYALILVALAFLACSDPKPASTSPGAITADESHEAADVKNRQIDDAKAERQFAAFVERSKSRALDIGPWRFDLTAKAQQQFDGQIVSFDGWIQDVVMLSAEEYEVTIALNQDPSTVAKLRTATDAAQKLIQTGKFFTPIYVTAKISSIKPVSLIARACDQPDCEEIKVEESNTGKSFRIRADLIDFEVHN